MRNEHCYNCISAMHCNHYKKDVCDYKGDISFDDIPEEFEDRYCKKRLL